VEAANNLGGVELDFSVESLSLVDDLIDSFRGEGLHVDDLDQTLVCFGCYVGEVLVRNNGGIWRFRNQVTLKEFSSFSIVVQLPDGSVCNPIGKVFKRMKHGPEDTLVWFHSVATRGLSRNGPGDT